MTVAASRFGLLKPNLASLLMTLLAACAGRPAPAPPPAAAAPSAPAQATAQATAMAETAPSPATGASFADWLQGVRQEAASQGISQQTLDAALAGIEPDQKVLDLDRSQPEFTITFAQYAAKTVTKQRIDQGRDLLDQYRPLLEKVSQAYGVQPQYIVALWAIESDYGRFTGGYSVIGSLATLAYGSSRQEMFRSELIDALTILQQKNITPEAMTGSLGRRHGPVPVHALDVPPLCGRFRRQGATQHLDRRGGCLRLHRQLPPEAPLASRSDLGPAGARAARPRREADRPQD
ncbi:MAG TPA: lytic murein transglycosylase, partial [Dongiaceae bacterium]